MRTFVARFGCLILSILLLPLFAIVIGPLLVLAALRGRQPAGPIIMNTVRYGLGGRIGAFMLGLAIWILVWGSLGWLAIANGLFVVPMMGSGPSDTVAAVTPTVVVFSPTPLPPTPTNIPSPTGTPTPLPATATNTVTAIPTTPPPTTTATLTATPTGLFNESLATETPTSTPELELGTATITPTPFPTPLPVDLVDRQAIIDAVEAGTMLLREATSLANEENLQNLETVWRDQALPVAQNFATELYESHAEPFDVQFEYIARPIINPNRNPLGEVVVTSRERWFYGDSTTTEDEVFEFIYALSQQGEDWVITHYTYHNLPLPTPTPSPGPTPTGQP